MNELVGSLDAPTRSALASRNLADLGPTAMDTIDHPLLAKATETISGRSAQDLHELKISAVTDNVWYKVKSGQARGAVWVDADGQPWLCAVGVRRDGDGDDFYADFGRRCVGGSSIFLPTEQDRARVVLERVYAADEVRTRLFRLKVVWAVARACTEGSDQTVELPTDIEPNSLEARNGATLHVGVAAAETGTGGLTLSLEIGDYVGNRYEDVLLEVQQAIPGLPLDEWEAFPDITGSSSPCWFTIIETAWVERLLAALERHGLEGLVQSAPDLTDGPGPYSHIVPNAGLADAIVNGSVTRALCGRTFVPRRDPQMHELCPQCSALEEKVEEMVTSPES